MTAREATGKLTKMSIGSNMSAGLRLVDAR